MGFDTVFDSEITDNQVLTVALSEQRTIITRDHRLAEKTLARKLVLLSSGDPLEQLKNVLQRCAVTVEASQLFSICPLCNIKVENINKEEFAARIPPYVYRTQDRFTRCPGCERIFWRGTHVERIKEHLAAAGIVIK